MNATELQPIPIVRDERNSEHQLLALFDAYALVDAYDLTLFERDLPGVTKLLATWAESRGLSTEETQHLEGRYANFAVRIGAPLMRHTISVLRYRELTADEVAELQRNATATKQVSLC